MIVLGGDVGGTRTRLGLCSVENRNISILAYEVYQTKKFDNLAQMVLAFLEGVDAHPRSAAFGIAGPVIDGVCKATNLPWTVDVAVLSRRIGISRTTIVNDFVAKAHGIGALRHSDLVVVQRGRHEGLANHVLIGPGTGLGEVVIAQHGGDVMVLASEGGHTDFGPQDVLQDELLVFLRKKYGHVSYERILSRQGVLDTYAFFKSKGVKESAGARQMIAGANPSDRASLILSLASKDVLCRKTADLFFSVFGAEAGNLALQAIAVGGVYLSGPLVSDNVRVLKQSPFLKSFQNKGRLSGLLKNMPVYVVRNEKFGVLGAAALASGLF